MNVHDLLWGKGPLLHVHDGEARSWQVMNEVLLFIADHALEGCRTLETGAGVTTLLFAMNRCVHTCVAPFADEIQRIRDYAREKDLRLDTVTFEVDTSDRVLPRLQTDPLDIVLLDGAHGFPVPLIDWYYTADRLKVGGFLILDDTQLWSVNILKQFLLLEPEWQIERDFWPRSAIFRKSKPGTCAKNEFAQRFVVKQTIDLLYPDHIEMIRPYVPEALVADLERQAGFGRLFSLERLGFRQAHAPENRVQDLQNASMARHDQMSTASDRREDVPNGSGGGPKRRARLIAHYLPQFHPIPENDRWWGKGFTEWTNVTKARPLFEGHYQPILPAELGLYDLRVPDIRIAQAELAREYGIEGFCYWHYWFNGKRLLERPLNEVVASGEPNFPFCVGWANDTWSGIWHGSPHKILIEQTYPGPRDEEAHFYALLPALTDTRYLKIEGKPLFLIYKPYKLPEPKRFLNHWRELAVKEGLPGFYFVGNARTIEWHNQYKADGFDAMTPHNPFLSVFHVFHPPQRQGTNWGFWEQRLPVKTFRNPYLKQSPGPEIIPYEEYVKIGLPPLPKDFDEFPCVVPNWDNTARSGTQGWVFLNSTPRLFQQHLHEAIEQVAHRPLGKRLVFLKSWNEWAEGNYLEPDLKFERGYLEACRAEVFG